MPELEENDSLESPSPKKGGKRIVVLVLAACLMAGGGAWFFLRHHEPSVNAASAEADKKVAAVLHLEDFVVNLADQDSRAFVKIGIDIGQSEAPKSKKEDDLNPVPAMRDAILAVITGYTSNVLLTSDGKIKLKREILQSLQEHVPEAHAVEVYFTEFLVQR